MTGAPHQQGVPGQTDRQEPDRARTRAVQMMVLGTVIAVLAPLGGFLAGSMVGPSRQVGEFDAMYLSMFSGLVVGSLGAVLILLGLVRWVRATRPAEPLA